MKKRKFKGKRIIGNVKHVNKLFEKKRLKFTIKKKILGRSAAELYPDDDKIDIIRAYRQ